MQKFYKGRTNNHLTWVMVDATDFATPESAMSAATKIKIYGKLRGATGTNFVSSGTGSLTNDITHVGASVNGIYTIALVKADLSDASAAWYDQYIVNLSATGAAYQTLVVDGGIDDSTMLSRTLIIVSAASDAASAAAQGNSRVLLVQSRLSDLDSRLVSDVSDIRSAIAAITVTLDASAISDIASAVVAALPITSQISDILSAVLVVQSMASDAASAAQQGNSRVILVQSRLSDFQSRVTQIIESGVSDIYSLVSSLDSEFGSRVPKGVATASALLLTQSLASDAASAAQQANSRALVTQSSMSDVASAVALLPVTKLNQQALAVLALVVGAGSTTTAVKFSTVEGAAPSATNDFYNGRVIVFTSGALAGQATSISDYDGASTTATVVALTGAPANTVTAVIA